jgi:hypothetical protein
VITISRKLKGLIPYRLVWFPTEAELNSLANDLPLTHMARVECADTDLAEAPCMVGHHLSVTLGIDLRRPLDDLFRAFNATARNRVRQAERFGGRLRIRHYNGGAENAGLLDEFVTLFDELVQRKRGAVFPISRGFVESFFPHADLFMADFDGQPMLGRLNLCDPHIGRIRTLYAASRRFDGPDAARIAGVVNVYQHWHEIQAYREAGFCVFDFGGISPVDDPGINWFKLQFGGEIERHHSYLLAGMPMPWRCAFGLFTTFTERGKRRQAVEQAGDQWRNVPLNQIRKLIEDECAPGRRQPIGDRA